MTAPEPLTAEAAGPRLLRGGPIAAEVRAAVAADVVAFREAHGFAPALAVVIVGHDAPSTVYLHKILDGCRTVGIVDRLVELPEDAGPARVAAAVAVLNEDPAVAGIIVQMPLPAHIPLRTVIDSIDPAKDIDGIHPRNAGLLSLGYDGFLPATAQASVEILKRSGIEIAGKRHSAVLVSEADWRAIQETLYLASIPGMRASIRRGLRTPVEKCYEGLDW